MAKNIDHYFPYYPNHPMVKELRERFGPRRDGAIEVDMSTMFKNQWWTLTIDGERWVFGYADLSHDDIFKIAAKLADNEEFRGYNEHHGTEWQQRDEPMVAFTNRDLWLCYDGSYPGTLLPTRA